MIKGLSIFFLFVFLVTFTHCLISKDSTITISIRASTKANATTIDFHGQQDGILYYKDKTAFQITDEILTEGVEAVMGAKPTWISLTTADYKQRRWNQVKRTLKPVKAEVISIKSQPTVISLQEFVNESSKKGVYKASICSEVKNAFANSWERSEAFSLGTEILYGFSIGTEDFSVDASASLSASITSSFGRSFSKEQATSISSSSEVIVELDPGQDMIASLTATKGTIEIEIKYLVSLKGDVYCYFENSYKGRKVWRQDINNILDAIGIPNFRYASEIIRIEFFTEAKITLMDKTTKKKVFEAPAVIST